MEIEKVKTKFSDVVSPHFERAEVRIDGGNIHFLVMKNQNKAMFSPSITTCDSDIKKIGYDIYFQELKEGFIEEFSKFQS
jgi:hypothetical protein